MLSSHLWRCLRKSGRTKVADWQDVGVEKSTRLSLSNWERPARNW